MHEVLTNYNNVHKSVLANLNQVPTELLKGNNKDVLKPGSFANPQSSPQVSSDKDYYVAVVTDTNNNMSQGEIITLAQKIYRSAPALLVNSTNSAPSNAATATDAASDPYAILDNLSGDSSINLMALLLLLVSQYLLPEQLKVADEELQVTRTINQSTATAVNTNAAGQIQILQNAYNKAMSGAENSIYASWGALGFAGLQAFTGFAGAFKENANVETTDLESSFHDMKNISEESQVLNQDAMGIAGKDGLTNLPDGNTFALSKSEQTEIAQTRLAAKNKVTENEATIKNISDRKEARQENLKTLAKKSKLEYRDINTLRKGLNKENAEFEQFNTSSTSVKTFNTEVENLKKYSPTLDETRGLFGHDATIDKFCQENNTFSVIRKIPDGSIAFLSCEDDFIQTGKVNVYSIAAGSIESHTPFEIDIENRSSVSEIINSQWENKAYLASHGNEVSSILGGAFGEDIDMPQWLSGDEGFHLFSKKLFTNAHEAENLRLMANSENKVAGNIKEFADKIGKNYPLEHHHMTSTSKLKNLTKRYEHVNAHHAKLLHLSSTVFQSLSQATSGLGQGLAAQANANADLLRGESQILSNVSGFIQQANQQLIDTLTRNISDIIGSVFGFVQAVAQTEARVTSTR